MDPIRLDSFDVFVAIVRCGGFRAAALERGISSSALSQTMNALEEALGIRLLNRTTRSVSPTEAGQRLLERLAPALSDIRLAIAEVDELRDSPSGTLRVNAPAPAVDHFLCPLAFDFMEVYREVKIEIISDAAVIDIVEQGFDAGVRFGKQLAQDMIALPLGPALRYAIVASPEYINRCGEPETPHELVHHDCVKRRFPGGTLVTWRFAEGDEEIEVTPTGRLTVSSAHNELQAALAGRGIAHVFDDYARPYLQDGRLVELLSDWSPTLPHWFLYYPSRRLPSAAMRAFLDYMRSYDWSAKDVLEPR
ncbi:MULTISPECIES: LysR family transcriptional regulator [Agrobacterium tumefaciens complex]|jgi:DNA-binding transcriptional LysR family regulator|uniref:LysR family transcriptional regulator n=1 Tax=Agrobacterium tumefaciens complex TaxID=1183400 RepID=UPI000760DF7B|nr:MULTISPECIES: LysR family transcriptional regulator [Agrobacterium tumefaciens complex]KAB0459096.1 LysR family transcriptional regulator [Agrobacterium tumefaciens]KWT79338.1 transcriptional regulator [Agrobacterium radiobacter]MBB4409170.1 DNA-binding transcriptional LysR family regulator [Agrobacterium radiobacter]MBB4454051.1 DNA-binding transcriptional LysR family regulator [Agrobacterium radiobacter]MBP2542096.1 DNA-binding transcriptional LysR family regulator [Agrobacterium tumefaci